MVCCRTHAVASSLPLLTVFLPDSLCLTPGCTASCLYVNSLYVIRLYVISLYAISLYVISSVRWAMAMFSNQRIYLCPGSSLSEETLINFPHFKFYVIQIIR